MNLNIPDIKHYYMEFLKDNMSFPELETAVLAVDSAVKHYMSDTQEGKTQLNDAYWAVVDAVINNRACEGEVEILNFSLSERFLINFGYFDQRLFEIENSFAEILNADNASLEEQADKLHLSIFYFSEWINSKYLQLIHVENKRSLDKKQAQIREELERIPKEIAELRSRRNLYHQNSRYEDELAQLSSLVEDNLLIFFKIEKRIERGDKMLLEEKQQYRDIRYLLSQLKSKKLTLLRDFVRTGEDVEIEILDDKIEVAIRRMVDLEFEIDKVASEIAEDIKDRRHLLERSKLKSGLLHQEDSAFKEMALTCAKRGSHVPNSVLLDNTNYILKWDLVVALKKLFEFDPKLFVNSIAAERGKPTFVIVPASGEGVYDETLNVIIIPFFPEVSVEETVAYGIADYRAKSDTNHALEYSYYEINPSVKRYGRDHFRNLFISSYVKWCLKESMGWPVFKKAERSWFEANIAPEGHVFRMPVWIREEMKTADGIKGLIMYSGETLKKNKEDGEANLILALLHWIKDDTTKALACFEKNIELAAPDNFVAHYNFALAVEIINRRMRSKKEYIVSQWNRYIRLEENSWWHTNAVRRLDALLKE